MSKAILDQLLIGNHRHSDSLPSDYFVSVEAGQEPPVVSVCCSDSRVSQEGMWSVEEPGWLFTPSTIGNQVWDYLDGDLVVDGSVLYPIAFTDTKVAVVVGHTGCGAVTAALESVRTGSFEAPPGVTKWVELLAPVIESGLDDVRVDENRETRLVDQLVEYNVDRQVAFLNENSDVPQDVTVYGFVYDFQGVYGDVPGRAYLVNADGETDLDTLRDTVPTEYEDHSRRLL